MVTELQNALPWLQS